MTRDLNHFGELIGRGTDTIIPPTRHLYLMAEEAIYAE